MSPATPAVKEALVKLCECGCGLPAPIAKITSRRAGHVKGQPIRFIHGHHGRGKLRLRQDLAERVWKFVDRTSTPDGCWLWTGSRNRQGYGTIWVNGRHRQATHIVLELAGFLIPPEGLQVRHAVCDNPPCCRARTICGSAHGRTTGTT
jgi:hypothetical protein